MFLTSWRKPCTTKTAGSQAGPGTGGDQPGADQQGIGQEKMMMSLNADFEDVK